MYIYIHIYKNNKSMCAFINHPHTRKVPRTTEPGGLARTPFVSQTRRCTFILRLLLSPRQQRSGSRPLFVGPYVHAAVTRFAFFALPV